MPAKNNNPKVQNKRIISFLTILKIFLIFLFLFSLSGIDVYDVPQLQSYSFPLSNFPTPALYPQNLKKNPFPNLTAEGIYVIDLNSQVVLYQKNSKMKLEPASTTKLISSLVSLEHYDLDEIKEVRTVITEGRVMGLVSGEKISVENLLYGTLVHSANDGVYALAENYPGGVSEFVKKMNEKVIALGLKDTNFTNPIGFSDPSHFTTAYDLAQISRVGLTNEIIRKIISTRAITVHDEDFTLFHNLENVNTLLGKVSGVAGVKTGYTKEAGEVLSTLVKRDKNEVLIVVLKSNDRFGETEAIINWVFDNYRFIDLNPI